MRVTISAEAEHELEAIGDHIAADIPTRAIGFVRELRAKCFSLAELPNRFPLVRRYEKFGIRRCLHGNYLIFYRAEPDRIAVIHILHGATDYAAILFAEGDEERQTRSS